jgi:hypothetical protein
MTPVRWLYHDPIYAHTFWSTTPPTSPDAISDPLLVGFDDGSVRAP